MHTTIIVASSHLSVVKRTIMEAYSDFSVERIVAYTQV